MNGTNQDVSHSPHSLITKVSAPAHLHRSMSHEPVPAWTKLYWKVKYWWHARWTWPNVKSPRSVAALAALGLVIGLVSITSAYSYTVRPGDTLFSIARRNNTTVAVLAATNQIANPDVIHVGQTLEIPEGQHAPTTAGASVASAAAPVSAASSSAGPSGQAHGAAGVTYVVQPGDTLYRIARRYGTTVTAVAQANNLYDVNTIHVGQVLLIPTGVGGSYSAPHAPAGQTPYTAYPPYAPPLYGPPALDPSQIPSSLPDVPHTPATTDPNPQVLANRGCARFNFMQGRDRNRGSIAGVYVLHDITGGPIASWTAGKGDLDSGWINGLPLSHRSVHVRVVFYPKYGGGSPIQMEIVNPAPGTAYGWLVQGACHSLEIQYPAGY